MQFSLVAYDHTDDDALNRRMACREVHLEGLRKLAREGHFISGGVLLNENGKMIGSNVHLAFEDRAALDAWLATEPYVTERVWDSIRIHDVKLFNPNA